MKEQAQKQEKNTMKQKNSIQKHKKIPDNNYLDYLDKIIDQLNVNEEEEIEQSKVVQSSEATNKVKIFNEIMDVKHNNTILQSENTNTIQNQELEISEKTDLNNQTIDKGPEFRTKDGKLVYKDKESNGIVYILNDNYDAFYNTLKINENNEEEYVPFHNNFYNNLKSGSLEKSSFYYQWLLTNSNRSTVGDAIMEIYNQSPQKYNSPSGENKCCLTSYDRSKEGYEKSMKKKFPKDDFENIWKRWDAIVNKEKLGITQDQLSIGSPFAVSFFGLGTIYSGNEIWTGILQPGAVMTWNNHIGGMHAVIFLGYSYNEEGKINGLNYWDDQQGSRTQNKEIEYFLDQKCWGANWNE